MQTKIIKINPNFPEEALIKESSMVLKKGGLVVFPTETVYGIAANFLDKKAVEKLQKVKQRPKDKPFSIHIARFEALNELGIELSDKINMLIHKFWPGPLTIVILNKKKEKIGIRMPRNKIALSLIEHAGVPIVAPSANISGEKPPISANEVISEMSGLVDIILDGGTVQIGRESTVLDVTVTPFKVLREGAIPKEELLADYHVLFVCTGNSCRSVMAKAILEKLLKQLGLSEKVFVDSAGTLSYSGMLAAPNTIEVMREEGTDVSSHRGKFITPELLKKSDFIFVMERTHRNAVLSMSPDLDSKVRFLKEESDIPDPIGSPVEEYRRVRDIIKDGVENIFLEFFKNLK